MPDAQFPIPHFPNSGFPIMSKINDRDFEFRNPSPRVVRLFDITTNQPFTVSVVTYPGSTAIDINLFDSHAQIVQEVTLELDNGKLVTEEHLYMGTDKQTELTQ